MIRYIEIAALLVAAAALPLADQPAEAMQSGVQECRKMLNSACY